MKPATLSKKFTAFGIVPVLLSQIVCAQTSSPPSFALMLQSPTTQQPNIHSLQDNPPDDIELRTDKYTVPAVAHEIQDNSSLEPISLRGVDTPDTLSVGIQRLVSIIEDTNLDMAIADTHIVQGHWYEVQAFSQFLPSLQSYNYLEHFYGSDTLVNGATTPANRVVQQLRFMASYDVQLGGGDWFTLKSARYGLKRLKNTYDETEQQTILNILTQYYQYLRDIAVIEVAEEALRQANIQLRLSESRYHAGFTTKLDVDQAQTLVAEKQGQLAQAKSQKVATEYGLAASINMPITMRIEPEDPDLRPIQLIDDEKTIPQLLQIALQNRSDLKALADSIEESKAAYAATRAQLMPTLNFSAYQRSIGPQANQMMGAKDIQEAISFDLMKNMGVNLWSQMQQSKSKIKEAQLTRQKQLFQLQQTLAEAYLNCDLSRKQIDITRQKVQSALEGFEVARRRRASGLGINLDVVQAQKDLSDARQEFYTAIMNYNNYELRLLYEIGQLTPDTLMTAMNNPMLNPKGNEYLPFPEISSLTSSP